MAAVAATGLVTSVAQMLLSTLQTKEQLKQLCSIFGYERELERLENSVAMIKAILLDVDCKQQHLSNEGRIVVERLKDAVYDADNLLDEFITVADQLQRMPGGKLSKKVRRFFSQKNQLLFGYQKSYEIKKLRQKLDEIADDCWKFGFINRPREISDVYVHVKRSREETVSVVNEESIIGREKDKEAIVSMLLSDTEEDVSFLCIVGMGGLGKTALAQLVFHDHRIKTTFKEDMYWVCVSEEFGKNEILAKMLPRKSYELKLEETNRQVQENIKGRRYLLVLDDVWCEKRELWVDLIEFLGVGGRGSRILITSRSLNVAKIVVLRKDSIHRLQGLSEDNSWDLFKRIAFRSGKEQEDNELVEIGKDITKKCCNVPLSIKVIGSLLYGQERNKWVSFKNINFAKMRQDSEDTIMSTLMFSYYNLTPQLKACFSFCSLFPKDYVIKKKKLVRLWVAQGYVIPSNEGRSMEDVGEEYFSILMQRCFFQDLRQDTYGRVESCKMHDLMHDLAQQVVGNEALVLTCNTDCVKKKIHHLSMARFEYFSNWCGASYCSSDTLRTLLQLVHYRNSAEQVMPVIKKYRCLRVLGLQNLGIRNLPNTISKLIHLRYLDLSFNSAMKNLPNSITNLHNLQTLVLRGCENLEELPEDTGKLVNLRILDIDGCHKLTYMPIEMCKLTCLRTLPLFVVGASDDSKHVKKGNIIDLKYLINHLKGELNIKFVLGGYANYQFKDEHDQTLVITFDDIGDQGDLQEMLLEHLPCNNHYLSDFQIYYYQGKKWPSWASPIADRFPRLVEIKLHTNGELKHLTSLSQLSHLKVMRLMHMQNLEYIENDSPLMPFFPSLEELTLYDMPKLKGWWRGIEWREREAGVGGCLVDANGVEQDVILPSFPILRELNITSCPNMTYFPPCPHVKTLEIGEVNDGLRFCMKGGIIPSTSAPTSSSNLNPTKDWESMSNDSEDDVPFCLDYVKIDNSVVFNSLFRVFVGGADTVNIYNLQEGESLLSLREGIENLTNLQFLTLSNCDKLELEDEKEWMPLKSLDSLEGLSFISLPKLVNVPKGLQYLHCLLSLHIEDCENLETLGECIGLLTSLYSLTISHCPNLIALPESLKFLTSLAKFEVVNCILLEDRCRAPDGEDWPKICHIPHLSISSDDLNVVDSD